MLKTYKVFSFKIKYIIMLICKKFRLFKFINFKSSFDILTKFNKKFYLDMVESEKKFSFVHDETDTLKDRYGVYPMNMSQSDPEERYKIVRTKISTLNKDQAENKFRIRARLQRSRIKGKGGFMVLRDGFSTLQAVMFVGDDVSKQMLKFVEHIPLESIVEVEGVLKTVEKPVESCTQQDVELAITSVFLVSDAMSVLPFQLEDANRKGLPDDEEDTGNDVKEEKKEEEKPTTTEGGVPAEKDKKKKSKEEKAKEKEEKAKEKEAAKGEKKEIIVSLKTRLDHRVLDLRVAANQAIFRLQSGISQLFREFLYKNDFIEIHSPKLIAGSSEGGANIFKLKYFEIDACLAQSPQLYKQMAVIGGLERVMEIGPVFRAENANTPRHMCEFTGLDMEMAFQDHYFEVLDVISDLFVYIFDGVHERYAFELNAIAQQYPFEKIKYLPKSLKLTFAEGVELLKQAGATQSLYEDLDTENEKLLGKLVKEKYDTDFYILYRYPKSARPFYTMPCPDDDNFTNSYDAFIRGEEILSGAQRIHTYDLLLNKIKDKGINPETLKDYLNSFKLGAPPHGGCGIGLERVVKLISGFKNIKKCCMFPRDPKRLTP
jgi:nondiscriminating aspartyl-tRNA synthetase